LSASSANHIKNPNNKDILEYSGEIPQIISQILLYIYPFFTLSGLMRSRCQRVGQSEKTDIYVAEEFRKAGPLRTAYPCVPPEVSFSMALL